MFRHHASQQWTSQAVHDNEGATFTVIGTLRHEVVNCSQCHVLLALASPEVCQRGNAETASISAGDATRY